MRRKARFAWLPVMIPAGAGRVRETSCSSAAPLGPFHGNGTEDGCALLSAPDRESDFQANPNAHRWRMAHVVAQPGGAGVGQGNGGVRFIVWND